MSRQVKILVALNVVALSCVAALLAWHDPAHAADPPAPTPAPASSVAFCDFARVMLADESLSDRTAKLVREGNEAKNTVALELDKKANEIRSKIRMVSPGSKEWRQLRLDILDLQDQALQGEHERQQRQMRKVRRMHADHYDYALQAVKEVCAESGYTVVVNLFDTGAAEDEVNIKNKALRDIVIYQSDAARDITARVIERQKKILEANGLGKPTEPKEPNGAAQPVGNDKKDDSKKDDAKKTEGAPVEPPKAN